MYVYVLCLFLIKQSTADIFVDELKIKLAEYDLGDIYQPLVLQQIGLRVTNSILCLSFDFANVFVGAV